MRVALLDVNVLVALFDPSHINHDEAHNWFGRHRRSGWATCPITINGCVRVLSSRAYSMVEATPSEVIVRLRQLCTSSDHRFWNDDVSLLQDDLFLPEMIAGPHQISDVYLLALAVRRGGRLITFDQKVPLKAVVGGAPDNVVVLGGIVSGG